MKKPRPRVRVVTYSKTMRMKRPFEVQLRDGNEDIGDEIPIARFSKRAHANAFAKAIRTIIKNASAWAKAAGEAPLEGG